MQWRFTASMTTETLPRGASTLSAKVSAKLLPPCRSRYPQADNKTCTASIFAGHLGNGDRVGGDKTVDIFSTNIIDINKTPLGNMRNMQLARLSFNPNSKRFDFVSDMPSSIRQFQVRAGDLLQWRLWLLGPKTRFLLSRILTRKARVFRTACLSSICKVPTCITTCVQWAL